MSECNKNFDLTVALIFLNQSKILEQLSDGKVIVLNTVNSTNQYIMDNILHMCSGDACVTEHQTHGRGRRGKIWVTSLGQAICLSIYWKIDKTPSSIVEFSLMISIVVARILKNLGVSQIQIKWPNDLYVHGRKLAGILIEMITGLDRFVHMIIGIGINVSMYTCVTLRTQINKNWINLRDIGITLDPNILVVMLINALRNELKYFSEFGCASCISYWKDFDLLYNKPITLLMDEYVICGKAVGIGAHGSLAVQQEGIIYYYSGENISVYMS